MDKTVFELDIKCVCGYEYKEVMYEHDEDKHIIMGDDPFVKVSIIPTGIVIGGCSYPDIYACPKCNTLQLCR